MDNTTGDGGGGGGEMQIRLISALIENESDLSRLLLKDKLGRMDYLELNVKLTRKSQSSQRLIFDS